VPFRGAALQRPARPTGASRPVRAAATAGAFPARDGGQAERAQRPQRQAQESASPTLARPALQGIDDGTRQAGERDPVPPLVRPELVALPVCPVVEVAVGAEIPFVIHRFKDAVASAGAAVARA
jgi:hypothetical protein